MAVKHLDLHAPGAAVVSGSSYALITGGQDGTLVQDLFLAKVGDRRTSTVVLMFLQLLEKTS